MLRPQTPIASGGWGLRSYAPSVTCFSCTNLLTTSPNLDRIKKFLICRSSPSLLANSGFEPNQSPQFLIFHSLFHNKYLFSKTSDDVIACDLRYSLPPNPKSRLCLCIKRFAICIPDAGRCILVLLAHRHERLLTTLQS